MVRCSPIDVQSYLCTLKMHLVPERRKGNHRLSPIALDVYLLIFDELQWPQREPDFYKFRKTMLSLCRVCRLFKTLCQPYLFKYTVLPYHPSDSDRTDDGPQPGRLSWFSGIKDDNPSATWLASCVQRCVLLPWEDRRIRRARDCLSTILEDYDDPPQVPFDNASLVPLATFKNLTVLHVHDFPITMQLLDRKSTRLNSSHSGESRMPSSA